MRFLINGKIIDIGITPEELFKMIMNMPVCTEKSGDFIRLSKLPQEQMIGTQEKGYIVVIPGNIRIGGTDGILHCIGISFHDPVNQKLVIAHLDIGIEPKSIAQILAEFKNAKDINIRLFGGMTAREAATIAGTTHQDSINLVMNICHFLYKAAENCPFNLNIVSADLFDKLEPFKAYAKEHLSSAKIGLAIDSQTGLILCLENQPFPFAVEINNCGLFRGPYKERGVCVRMHDHLGFDSTELAKRFDNTSPEWQEQYYKEIESRSIHGVISILLIALNGDRLAVNKPYAFTDEPLIKFIFANLPIWLEQLSVPKQLYQQLLLNHICFDLIKDNDKLLQQFPYHDRNELPLERVLSLKIIQKWCLAQTRNQVIDFLAKNDEAKQLSLIQLFNSFKGSLHLLNELVNFQLIEEDVRKHYIETNPTLIAKLKDVSIDQAAKLINDWKHEIIASGVDRYAKNICAKLLGDFKKPEIQTIVFEALKKIFENYHKEICDLDIFHALHQPMNQKLAECGQQLQAALEQIQKQVQETTQRLPPEKSLLESLCVCFSRSSSPPPFDVNQILQEQAQKVINEILNKNFSEIAQAQNLTILRVQSESTALRPPL